jgi:glycerate kinase
VRLLICPDSFTGTLSAAQAAAAIAEGWARAAPGDAAVLRPLSDGGPGFLDAIQAGESGTRRHLTVRGPLGAPVAAAYLVTPDGTAWVESAEAAGLHLVPAERRDPTRTTSWGVGELIGAAAREGAGRIVVGVGGTGTSDGGAGLLGGLGARSVPDGLLGGGGGALLALAEVDLAPAQAVVGGCALEVATDVDVPLLGPRGSARGFAPQKGATPEQVESLEESLAHWAGLLGRTAGGRSPAAALGAGAGGGIGAALLRIGARRVPGIETVLTAAGIAELLGDVDLVITGEGAFDWQSLHGKAVSGVAALALRRAIPTVVLAGRLDLSRREWITAGVAGAYPAAAEPGENPADGLARAAERAARTWSRT